MSFRRVDSSVASPASLSLNQMAIPSWAGEVWTVEPQVWSGKGDEGASNRLSD